MTHIKIIVVFSLWLCASYSVAQELTLTGNYQGKDLFIQNPYNQVTKKFCTEKIYVNDILIIDNPSISAIRVDLSKVPLNQEVKVRVVHASGCKPKIINPTALKSASQFQFITATSDNNSILWSTDGEKKGGRFYLNRQLKNGTWSVLDTIDAKGLSTNNRYAIAPYHQQGDNLYKLIYENNDGKKVESQNFSYTASENYITFFPQIATTSLTLSDSTGYQVEDYFGKIIMKGQGKQVVVLNLKPGKYYLVIQNRREQFIKK